MGVSEDKQLKPPPPDSVEVIRPLNSIDRAFHEHVLRHAKGIVKLYEEWIKTRSK